MIVWIFFSPGAGGDGLANLLEQSPSVVALDGIKPWRIHRYVDDKAKFWAPTLQDTLRRTNKVDQLNAQQLKIANSDTQYLVITSHDTQLANTFQYDILSKEKHIKVLLLSKNFNDSLRVGMRKNLIEFNLSAPTINLEPSTSPDMDFILYIDEIINSWEYTKQFVENIGLPVSQSTFEYYKKLVSGEFLYTTPGIEYYNSSVDADNIVRYVKIK